MPGSEKTKRRRGNDAGRGGRRGTNGISQMAHNQDKSTTPVTQPLPNSLGVQGTQSTEDFNYNIDTSQTPSNVQRPFSQPPPIFPPSSHPFDHQLQTGAVFRNSSAPPQWHGQHFRQYPNADLWSAPVAPMSSLQHDPSNNANPPFFPETFETAAGANEFLKTPEGSAWLSDAGKIIGTGGLLEVGSNTMQTDPRTQGGAVLSEAPLAVFQPQASENFPQHQEGPAGITQPPRVEGTMWFNEEANISGQLSDFQVRWLEEEKRIMYSFCKFLHACREGWVNKHGEFQTRDPILEKILVDAITRCSVRQKENEEALEAYRQSQGV